MPSSRPHAAAQRAAPRHEMDELEDEGAAEQAAAAPKSKLPIFVGGGAAAAVLVALVVWGLAHKGSSPAPVADPGPQQQAAPVQAQARVDPPPPAPAPQPAIPPAAKQPEPTATPEPTPAVTARVETPAPPPRVEAPPPPKPAHHGPTKVGSVSTVSTKGVRLVKSELNSIPTPPAASGDGVLAVVATPWAEVAIDGRDIGETPREVKLGAGSYRVKATHPALGTREQIVTIRPGKREMWKPTFAN
jgi:hypothetical protein